VSGLPGGGGASGHGDAEDWGGPLEQNDIVVACLPRSIYYLGWACADGSAGGKSGRQAGDGDGRLGGRGEMMLGCLRYRAWRRLEACLVYRSRRACGDKHTLTAKRHNAVSCFSVTGEKRLFGWLATHLSVCYISAW